MSGAPAQPVPTEADLVEVDLEPIHPDEAPAEPVRAERVRADAGRTERVQAEPVQAEPVQAEPVQGDGGEAEPTRVGVDPAGLLAADVDPADVDPDANERDVTDPDATAPEVADSAMTAREAADPGPAALTAARAVAADGGRPERLPPPTSGSRSAARPEPGGGSAGPAGPAAAAGSGQVGTSSPARPRRLGKAPAGVVIGVLVGLLGFGLVVQLQNNTSSNGLAGARQEDLVRILDDLSSREERLRRQIASLDAARTKLATAGDSSAAALEEARTRATALAILAGTAAAQGPGIQVTMTDPAAKLGAEDLLDAVEEVRAAGAEAIQLGPVRIGLDSAFTASDNGAIKADGQLLPRPYVLLAIGDPATLATALNIPGGVVDTARAAGGRTSIAQQSRLVITALRSLSTPHYAQPADGGK